MAVLYRRLRRFHPVVSWLAAVFLCVAAYGLLVGLALPPLLKHLSEDRASRQLGRVVSIKAIDINPWTLAIDIQGLSVASAATVEANGSVTPESVADPRRPQVEVDHVVLDLSIESLWRLAPVLDELKIDRPVVRLSRSPQGHFDFDDVLARLAQDQSADNSSSTPRFVLSNVQVTDGRLELDDHLNGQSHVVDQLNASVPFLSSLDAAHDTLVKPSLSFQLDGSPFESTAESRPFALGRGTSASFRLEGLALEPYLPYLPADLPVHLTQGRLSLDLAVSFEEVDQQPRLTLSGTTGIEDGRLVDAAGQPFASVEKLTVHLDKLDPIARQLHLSAVEVDALEMQVARDTDGRLSWQTNLPTSGAEVVVAAPERREPLAAGTATAAVEPQWALQLDRLVVRRSAVDWSDAQVQPATRLRLDDIDVDVKALAWPMIRPATVEVSARQGTARIELSGQAGEGQADLHVKLDRLAIAPFASYIEDLRAKPVGTLSLAGGLAWQGGDDWRVQVDQASVDGFVLNPEAGGGKARANNPGWTRLALKGVMVDMPSRTARVDALVLQQPRLMLSRQRDGRWMYMDWWRAGTVAKPAVMQGRHGMAIKATSPKVAASARSSAARSPASTWNWSVGSMAVKGGALQYRDAAMTSTLALDVRDVNLELGSWSSKPTAASAIRLEAKIAGTTGAAGSMLLVGRLADFVEGVPQRLDASRVNLRRLPLHLMAPFVPALAQLDLRRADGSFTGGGSVQQLAGGLRIAAKGDARIDEVRADERMPSGLDEAARRAWGAQDRQLISWRSLQLDGLDFALTPDARGRLDVGSTTLVDLFARLVVTPQGELNLQGLYRTPDTQGPAGSAISAAQATAGEGAAGPRADTVAEAANDSFIVNLGPSRMVNGRVAFTDQFVQPSYSANLSQLTGRLGAFSSVSSAGEPQLAELELQGVAQETAELLISGQVNPLAQPLVLDIRGQVRDLDLPPLSPYSVKYAGYGIERGKLNVDVRYQINQQGRLTASNKIVLSQLAFGDRAGESSLPVKLAVALLADRNGVIDVELPVSGSINDPQFSLGGLIWRAVGNLLVKAVTAPFALLSSAFGSGRSNAEQSAVPFDAGTKWLNPPAIAGLDKLAQVLIDKPDLQITLSGRANFDAERLEFQRAELARMVAETASTGRAPQGSDARGGDGNSRRWLAPDVPTGTAYEQALGQLYRRSDVAKPRNFIGIAKSLPVADMEKLIMATIPATPAILQQVAAERAIAVRAYLVSRGVPAGRIYLGVARLDTTTTGNESPHVDVSLQLR